MVGTFEPRVRRLTRTALVRRIKGASAPLGPDRLTAWIYGDGRNWSPAMYALAKDIAEQMGEVGEAVMELITAILALISGQSIDN